MEQSAPCTPETGPLSTSREDMMCESRGSRTPASGCMGTPFTTEAQSPLGQLDPHRLRDMVVDKQNSGYHAQVGSPYKQQQQQYWETPHSGGPTPSPSNIRPIPNSSSPMTPMMHPPRMSQGSAIRDSAMMSPGAVRTSMQQQQMGMCLPGRSPLSSPGGMHPPASPYIARPPSNASPSPYMQPPQTPVHYPQGMQQMPQNSAPAVVLPPGQVPPASPSGVYPPRINTMGPPQQQYTYHSQVQPQWNSQPQAHYVGQPQMVGASGPPQRVMVQRVPYPGSAYSQGMAQPQSSSGQPPPAPVVYSQGTVSASVQPQPQRAVYPTPGPQMGPPVQQGPIPPAQYPTNYYQQKGQPGYPPQPQMYRQQPTQSVPVRAFLGNQPPQMASSPVYPMYPAPNASAQQNSQPQQYSPASRYPAPVQNTAAISPCYQQTGHDMRSPQLMSPTQAPVVPAGVPQSGPPVMVAPVAANAPPMQRSMSNIELQAGGTSVPPQHLRMVSQSPPFYGHEPSIANSVQPDMCLVGCFFIVLEHERVLVDRLDIQEMTAVVRLHGGEIEFGPRAYNSVNSERITHVVCESVRHQLVQQALKERKRCVTLQWLNDVLAKKHLEVPWRVSHLPTFWTEGHRPAVGKIIAISGFHESERNGIRMMITAIGARFTPYLTKHNHFLVTKSCEGEKVERSRELGVAVVTYQWLVEVYLGIKTAVHDGETGYYPMPGMVTDVNVSPYAMEHYTEFCKQLLGPWRTPIIFSSEQWQRATDIKRSVEEDENIFPNKKIRMTTPPPTEELIEQRRAQIGGADDAPVVCFSGFNTEEVDALGKKVRFLGGSVTNSVSECTHLVVLNLWRTMKLLEAIALGKNVVGPDWVTDGYRCRIFPDTLDYFIHDEENEKAFGYNLKYSVLKARYRKVFEDVTFYLTPSVEPSYSKLSALITLAGGKVLKEKPQPHFVIQCIETDAPLVLVGSDSDVHLLQYLTDCGIPVFNVEIVLTGILRQKLENSPFYRITPVRPPPHQSPAPNPPASRTQQSAPQRIAA